MYQRLRRELDSRNHSVYWLAKQTGLNQSTLYNGIRYGCLFPKHRRLISEVLGVPEVELFTPEERGERNGR